MTNEEILRSTVNNAVEKLLTTISDKFAQLNFSDIVKTTQEAVNCLATKLIEQIVKITDELYDAQRNKHEITLRHTKTRKMVSSMGDLALRRNLYFDKKRQRYFFAVDELLKIEKYSRIEHELKTKLINDATLTSYGKASSLSGNCVSRQTVHNIVRRVPAESLDVTINGFKKVKQIYIEADEDHIHLNNGKSAEVKLVYVHEGRNKVCKGRTELRNARYFVSISNGLEIWDTVADYLYFQYDLTDTKILISGDGAAWIKYGLTVFPKAEYVIDKFHIYKSVTDACAGNKKLRKSIIESIKNDDRDNVVKLYTQRWRSEPKVKQRRRLVDSLSYIENNFDSIDLTAEYSCSAEGHVSHVLSERLSSRPMAWSKRGAEKIAKLRAYYFNGGDFQNLTLAYAKTEDTKVKNNRNLFAICKSETIHAIPSGRLCTDGLTTAISRELKQILNGLQNK